MKVLSRYLLKQHLLPFVFALSAMTGIMLLNQIARRLEELLGKGLPWTVVVEFFALTIPFIVAMTLSMAVLVAVLYTVSHMAADHEVTAMRAGGISLGQILRPLLAASVVVTVVAFVFSDQILPRTNHRLRSLMTDIYRTRPTFSLKEHVINEVKQGRLALRAAEIDQSTYRMRDVSVFNLGNSQQWQVVYADSGRLSFAPNQEDLHLTLYDGTVHEFDRRDLGRLQQTAYRRQVIKVPGVGGDFVRREGDTYRGDREMGVCQLEEVVRSARSNARVADLRTEQARLNGLRSLVGLAPVEFDTLGTSDPPSLYCGALKRFAAWLLPAELRAGQQQERDSVERRLVERFNEPARRAYVSGVIPRNTLNEVRIFQDRAHSARITAAVYAVELHKKYAIPAACIVFTLVGVAMALRFPRGGVGLVVGASLVIFTVYYVGLIGGESLANRLIVPPFWAMWTPNIVFGLGGLIALRAVQRQGVVISRTAREESKPAP
ncbi:MAG: LptF/LptG family permease [Gemmatimonadales bacterium]